MVSADGIWTHVVKLQKKKNRKETAIHKRRNNTQNITETKYTQSRKDTQ